MSAESIIVATLSERPQPGDLRALSGQASVLEVRADLVGEIDVDWLRSNFGGQLLYTLRTRAEGGQSDASEATRRARLIEAAREHDLVDLEGDRDLQADVLAAVPPSRRVISWHGPPTVLSGLQEVFQRQTRAEARYYKLVPRAERPGQELSPLALLHSLRRDDVIAFAAGSVGAWTRFLAPRLGAPVVYASAGASPAAAGQLPVAKLIRDYGLPELPTVRQLFGIVGADVTHSLSPRLHNAAYRALDLPALYVPFPVEAFGDFWLEVVESGSLDVLGFELKGLSVTSPHKRVAAAVASALSPLAEWIGSANTLVCRTGVWEAESTDAEGLLGALRARELELSGLQAAVVGAGGAGRAAVAALSKAGAQVRLVNRGVEKGRKCAAELHVPFSALEGFRPSGKLLLVNATPLGRWPEDPVPFEVGQLSADSVVVDLVYLETEPTSLVRMARQAGCTAIDGREVLLHQALPQFRLMTGQEMSLQESVALLGLQD